jgi:pimeloyl-ACP methyl ester carboxylesterase
LVLLHWLSASLIAWREARYVEALKSDHRLILIDARGHGASDKPHDPEAYRVELMVADIVSVLDDLAISKAHFLGYSMGGWIGWGIAKYAPERFHSLMISGSIKGETTESDRAKPDPFVDLFRQGMEPSVAAMEQRFGEWWSPALRARWVRNDLQALAAVLSPKKRPDFRDVGPEEFYRNIALPCLVWVGEADDDYSHRQYIDLIPNATFVALPGLDHTDAAFRLDLVLPYIRKFLAKVS